MFTYNYRHCLKALPIRVNGLTAKEESFQELAESDQ